MLPYAKIFFLKNRIWKIKKPKRKVKKSKKAKKIKKVNKYHAGRADYIWARIENQDYFLNVKVKGHFDNFDHKWVFVIFAFLTPLFNISNT